MATFRSIWCFSITWLVLAVLVGVATQLPTAPEPSYAELDPELRAWRDAGKVHQVFGRSLYARVFEHTGTNPDPPTFILIHGFPSSSFEYRHAAPLLAAHGRVVVWDHLGFGFSDKPGNDEGVTYSVHEHAEYALQLWRKLGITKAHVVAHDLGDSVLTEILSRWERGMLPAPYGYCNDGSGSGATGVAPGDQFFQSVTFTNGGMRLQFADLRVTQRLLLSPVGPFFNDLVLRLDPTRRVPRQQLSSVWSPTADPEQRARDVKLMLDHNAYNGGGPQLYRTIYYLNDRKAFEQRWMRSLRAIDTGACGIHPRIVWGDADAVAPTAIAESLHTTALRTHPPTYIRGAGHFVMLERPAEWAAAVVEAAGLS